MVKGSRNNLYLPITNDEIFPGVKCPPPPPLLNGVRAFSSIRYPALVISQCNAGYLRAGPREIRCLKSGSWSGGYAACNGEFDLF